MKECGKRNTMQLPMSYMFRPKKRPSSVFVQKHKKETSCYKKPEDDSFGLTHVTHC